MRVLIVEDDPDQRRLLALVVRGRGHDVVECASLEQARAAGPCELAFVDKTLPDGDGLEFARALPGRVYLLTGDDVEPRQAGIEVLVKPVRPAQLNALLS